MKKTNVVASLAVAVILAATTGYIIEIRNVRLTTVTIDSATTITIVSTSTFTRSFPPYSITCEVIGHGGGNTMRVTSYPNGTVKSEIGTTYSWITTAYATTTYANNTSGYVFAKTSGDAPFGYYVTACTYLP